MKTPEERYESTADAMVARILETFKRHPEAAALDDVWKLFKVEGFKCDDIGPSLAQAGWAFVEAKRQWRDMRKPKP